MNVDSILGRLRGVQHSGNGWQSLCPSHADKNPSLSIAARDGKVLMFCHAGCSVEAISAALKIEVSDLFSEPGAVQLKPRAVREAEMQIQNLRSRLTPRERILSVTIVYCDSENLDAGIARALALAVEGEIVQAVLENQE